MSQKYCRIPRAALAVATKKIQWYVLSTWSILT
jgi:hypothetical protein